MAQRGDYSKDERFPSYEKGATLRNGTDGEKDSLGAKADGNTCELGGHQDYLTREHFTNEDLHGGACRYGMTHWSDPPMLMTIGRIEVVPDDNDDGYLVDEAKRMRDFKHFYMRPGVETLDMIRDEPE
jgi:hypothetical protein